MSRDYSTLPPPPDGKTGWPWTISNAAQEQSVKPSDLGGLPLISIVTPSYNSAAFIEQTIRSVALQSYPNFEHIIIDGGSTDGTVDIIRRYEMHIKYWVSERDAGQSDAIEKGLARCDGEIFNWLNADDYLAEGALEVIGREIGDAHALAGAVINFDETGRTIRYQNQNLSVESLVLERPWESTLSNARTVFHQPGFWMRRSIIRDIGGFWRESHYVFDRELVIRYLDVAPGIAYTKSLLVWFREHQDSKSIALADRFEPEFEAMLDRLALRRTPAIQRAVEAAMRQRRWGDLLAAPIEEKPTERLKQIVALFCAVLSSPQQRAGRMALGRLKKLLID